MLWLYPVHFQVTTGGISYMKRYGHAPQTAHMLMFCHGIINYTCPHGYDRVPVNKLAQFEHTYPGRKYSVLNFFICVGPYTSHGLLDLFQCFDYQALRPQSAPFILKREGEPRHQITSLLALWWQCKRFTDGLEKTPNIKFGQDYWRGVRVGDPIGNFGQRRSSIAPRRLPIMLELSVKRLGFCE